MNKLKITLFSTILASALMSAPGAAAQQSSWSQCQDGRAIVRCETYNCPQGDTNGDGRCTLADTNASLTDARNDAFCANPISGCGQIQYYPSGTNQACLTKVEEGPVNCNLYAVASPTFTPQATPTASPAATAAGGGLTVGSPSPSPAGTTKGGEELPKTGPEHVFIGAAVLLLGAAGVFLFEKYKTV